MMARSAKNAPETRAERRTRQGKRRGTRQGVDLRFFALNAAFLLGAAAVAALQWWTIYRSWWFVVTIALALASATAIAFVGATRRWSALLVAGVTAAAYLVLGLPAGAPSMITDSTTLLPGLIAVITAPITGWKNLLTLDLPLGGYQATLAPVFFAFLVVTVISLSLAWRSTRLWAAPAFLGLILPVGAIAFGSSTLAGISRTGRNIPGALELFVGIVTLLVLTGWLLWRVRHARRAALDQARRASGVRVTARSRRTLAGRIGLGAAMVVAALVVGVAVGPWALAGQTRDVLRTDVDPRLVLRSTLSPLTDYRAFFGDTQYDAVQFTVSTDESAGIDRVRLATLSYYDGQVMRATDPAGGAPASTAFVRVPQQVGGGVGDRVDADISIGAYSGVWVPQVGALEAIRFDGGSRAALSDGFYYSPAGITGVELADPGLRSGIRYSLTSRVPDEAPDVATLTSVGTGPSLPEGVVPESLRAWITAQEVPGGGAGLATLIERLRARGYLSHALSVNAEAPPAWLSELGSNPFEPSRAGHSTDRIGVLFTQLLTKQNEVSKDSDPALLVAAPGDDEQFAVAGAMIADQLGFRSRVVLGARLRSTDQNLPVCQNGACTGAAMSAWIEVQDSSGAWATIDTSPQSALPLAPDVQDRRDPQNTTDVPPDRADTIQPPEPNPADAGNPDPPRTDEGIDWAMIGTIARIAGVSLIVLLVLFGPFLAIVVAKALRRRSRRNSSDVVDRFVGGWDEYVDAAVDAGRTAPRSATRTEFARAVDPDSAAPLAIAEWADRSVFADERPDDQDGDEFWQLIDRERRALIADRGRFARLRARLSLRSFTRGLIGR
ncbi:transglutaminase domain-containing protein [uncultured Microbacterium sp.]|uniref:DUF3488 domain-containing protein n=1 Tax=uncultured Microbacterium sp. TaxID=191216 RepID=UPI0025DE546D|nr:transglutaminase domain-containing protein [uncultured Microbacterium sp.]